MEIIELVIDEEQELSGIDAISVVENPAIEVDFIALKDQEQIRLAEVSKEKKILMGAALIPDKPIYRNSNGHEFYIYFSKDTVAKASQMFLKKGNQSKATLEHTEEKLSGMTVVESWLIEDEVHDKSRKYGLNMPVGTWMVSMKVDNEEIWNDYVKENKVKGFSIEGYFADKLNRPQDKQKDQLKNQKVNDEFMIIDDRLAYSTEDKAKEIAEDIGCGGFHEHKIDGQTWYMPCEQHSLEAGENSKSPCWDGYEQKGWKKGKDGKKVPNCEKKKYSEEELLKQIIDVIQEQE